MANTTTKKKSADPLPYIISFAILFLIALGVLTWVLSVFYKSYGCSYYPNIWCSDTWTCQSTCSSGFIPGTRIVPNPCFGSPGSSGSIGPTGLASCLFGPDSNTATVCFFAPTGGPPEGGTGLSCACPAAMQGPNVLNCFNGCGLGLESVQQPTSGQNSKFCCCNDPSIPACAITPDGKTATGPCAATIS